MAYRYHARSVGGFIQQAAVYYVQRGYYFYVLGRVPKGTRCRQIDRKILAKYEIELSKDQRYRRKKQGQANIQYLRYQDTFLLLATEGEHPFFAKNKPRFRMRGSRRSGCSATPSPTKMVGSWWAWMRKLTGISGRTSSASPSGEPRTL